MLVDILLPQWGMGMQEGTIVRWYRAVGDRVAEGDALCEVETAKATDDLGAPEGGVIAELLVEEGATVPVGEVLGRITVD